MNAPVAEGRIYAVAKKDVDVKKERKIRGGGTRIEGQVA